MNWMFVDESRRIIFRILDDGSTESGFAEVLAPGQDFVIFVPPLEQRIASLLAAVDAHLNTAAKAKGYDSIARAALRSAYAGPWRAEGLAFAQWMDAVYARCYELLAQFQAGELDEPTTETLIDMLPKLELP